MHCWRRLIYSIVVSLLSHAAGFSSDVEQEAFHEMPWNHEGSCRIILTIVPQDASERPPIPIRKHLKKFHTCKSKRVTTFLHMSIAVYK